VGGLLLRGGREKEGGEGRMGRGEGLVIKGREGVREGLTYKEDGKRGEGSFPQSRDERNKSLKNVG